MPFQRHFFAPFLTIKSIVTKSLESRDRASIFINQSTEKDHVRVNTSYPIAGKGRWSRLEGRATVIRTALLTQSPRDNLYYGLDPVYARLGSRSARAGEFSSAIWSRLNHRTYLIIAPKPLSVRCTSRPALCSRLPPTYSDMRAALSPTPEQSPGTVKCERTSPLWDRAQPKHVCKCKWLRRLHTVQERYVERDNSRWFTVKEQNRSSRKSDQFWNVGKFLSERL